MTQCPACHADNADGATVCAHCGAQLLANPFSTPVELPQQPSVDREGDATGGVIPYKNPNALLAYYLGIFSGFPLIGLPIGIAAFVLGVLGLRDRKRNPAIRGSVHAGIGIGCGGFFALLWTLAIVAIIVAAVSAP